MLKLITILKTDLKIGSNSLVIISIIRTENLPSEFYLLCARAGRLVPDQVFIALSCP